MSEQNAIISRKLLDFAKKIEEALFKIAKDLKHKCPELACLIHDIHVKNTWSVMQAQSEDEYRCKLDIGISRSTWYAYRRIALALLPFMPRKIFCSITMANLGLLSTLPEKHRKDSEWWKKAQRLKGYELEELVDKVLAKGGKGSGQGEIETLTMLKIPMYTEQKKFCVGVLEKFCAEEEIPIDQIGRALELILADFAAGHQQNLLIAIRKVMLPEIRHVLEVAKSGNQPADEQLRLFGNVVKKVEDSLLAIMAQAGVTEKTLAAT